MVLAPYGHDADEICRILQEAAFQTQPCADVATLCSAIREGAATAIISQEALTPDAREHVKTAVEGQPPWSDFPLLILTLHSGGQGNGWQLLQDLSKVTQIRLLERPLRSPALVAAVRATVRMRCRQCKVADDLAARRQAEQSLRRQQQLLQQVIDTIPVMLFIWDPALRRFTSNRHVEQVLGWTAADLVAGDFMEKAYPDPDYRAMVSECMAAPTPGWREFNVTAKDGTVVPSQWANFRLNDDVRIGIGLDLRERKQAERKLKQLNETLELQESERTAVAERRAHDLSRLAAELSEAEHRERKRLARLLHDDLQQLLLAMKLRLPVILETDSSHLAEHVAKFDEMISECLNTSRDLTRELSPPVIEYGSLPEVLAWLGGWFGETHHLEVGLDIPGNMPDAPEYLRVFVFDAVRELLFNVVKHSGTLEAQIGLRLEERRLVVEVSDHGDHFDPAAVRVRLQHPEGFGLFNIRERLEALGGRLEIAKAPGGGACFRLLLPAEAQDPLPPPETADAPLRRRRPRKDGIRLLVVDDHQVVREGMVELLNREDNLVVVGEAANGEEAIRLVESLCPDAVLMDVDLPGISGIETTREIKRRRDDTVVIGLSLHEDDSIRRAMTEAGADCYVSKHAPATVLVEAIFQKCF